MALIEVVILIPEADNDGLAFEHALGDELRERAVGLAGGFTIGGRVEGGWSDGGRRYVEHHTQLVLAIESFRQVSAVLALADWVRIAYRQEAVYVKIAGVVEILGGG